MTWSSLTPTFLRMCPLLQVSRNKAVDEALCGVSCLSGFCPFGVVGNTWVTPEQGIPKMPMVLHCKNAWPGYIGWDSFKRSHVLRRRCNAGLHRSCAACCGTWSIALQHDRTDAWTHRIGGIMGTH